MGETAKVTAAFARLGGCAFVPPPQKNNAVETQFWVGGKSGGDYTLAGKKNKKLGLGESVKKCWQHPPPLGQQGTSHWGSQ